MQGSSALHKQQASAWAGLACMASTRAADSRRRSRVSFLAIGIASAACERRQAAGGMVVSRCSGRRARRRVELKAVHYPKT